MPWHAIFFSYKKLIIDTGITYKMVWLNFASHHTEEPYMVHMRSGKFHCTSSLNHLLKIFKQVKNEHHRRVKPLPSHEHRLHRRHQRHHQRRHQRHPKMPLLISMERLKIKLYTWINLLNSGRIAISPIYNISGS